MTLLLFQSQFLFSQSRDDIFNCILISSNIREIKDLMYSTKSSKGNMAFILENEELRMFLAYQNDTISVSTMQLMQKNPIRIVKNLDFYLHPDLKLCTIFRRIFWDKNKNRLLLKFDGIEIKERILSNELFRATIYLKLKKGKWVIKKKKIVFPNKE